MKLPMRACCLGILAGCLGPGSGELTPAYVENGRLAIELCAQEYTKLANRPFLSEVDRAYVYVVSDQLDVLFTRGEVGTFGKRSSTYSAILGCGVLFNQAKASEIYFLSRPLRDPLIHREDVPQVTDRVLKEPIWELLYIMEGEHLKFTKGHEFKPEEIGDLTESIEHIQ